MTEPFDSYPQGGRALQPRLGNGSSGCRRGYGLDFMQRTGQTRCAYCGLDLVGSYENWLTMALDHVVPRSLCNRLDVDPSWRDDLTNLVLCCAACNTFGNRYRDPEAARPETPEAFWDLRDWIFEDRKARILARHSDERDFFDQKHWAAGVGQPEQPAEATV